MSPLKLPAIILIEPQLGENIGSTARAMKNFGFSDLRIVNPRDGWPNQKALEMAANGEDLIHSAKVYSSMIDAIADLNYLYATTTKIRKINKKNIFSSNIPSSFNFNLSAGIIFGRENSGLTNAEISLANETINIHTQNFTSLNLAQAVLIICYELTNKLDSLITSRSLRKQASLPHPDIANKHELKLFIDTLMNGLEEKNFFRVNEKKDQMKIHINNIFTRIDNLTTKELQILYGILKALKLR